VLKDVHDIYIAVVEHVLMDLMTLPPTARVAQHDVVFRFDLLECGERRGGQLLPGPETAV
jgi:hypothetical protein